MEFGVVLVQQVDRYRHGIQPQQDLADGAMQYRREIGAPDPSKPASTAVFTGRVAARHRNEPFRASI
ncbi:hypothetical protein [Streptomyces sp. NPDC001307]|uniref:hypothetical protein n=1 Tax=Streptomyces sp. NPDC001307 TaxID=3364560 RepID=UPI003685A3AB